MKKTLLLSALCLSHLLWAYSPEKAAFSIEINGETNPYKIYSLFVMPGSEISIKSQVSLTIRFEGQPIEPSQGQWLVKAPDVPGAYAVNILDNKDGQMLINVLVLTPLTQKSGEYLNGYRIGNYPSKPLDGNPIYSAPTGLFEVTMENEDLLLTPHFSLKQFVCKQSGGYPKYLVVCERLLLKLEYLLETVNTNGFEINTFGFISGYRTPFYNASIKNVQYSMHVYGGAADIFIDQNGDGSMDDLNGDGLINENDVRIFYDLVADQFDKPSYNRFKGGLGFYRKNGRHNGFIHVDVRGWKARW